MIETRYGYIKVIAMKKGRLADYIGFRCTPEEREALEEIAYRRRENPSALAREFIAEGVRREETEA